jgi:hypothetical protein
MKLIPLMYPKREVCGKVVELRKDRHASKWHDNLNPNPLVMIIPGVNSTSSNDENGT